MEVKSVGTFPVILLKLVTLPLPPQTKLNLEQNGWKCVLFLATTLLGEVGGRRDKTQSRTKIVLRSRVLRNNCLEGLFHTVWSSFDLHWSYGCTREVRKALKKLELLSATSWATLRLLLCCPNFSRASITWFIFFPSLRAGGILQILQSDWFRERAVFYDLAR